MQSEQLKEDLRKLNEMKDCFKALTMYEYQPEIERLIALAQAYLSAEMPEEKVLLENCKLGQSYRDGFNEALRLCRLAMAKENSYWEAMKEGMQQRIDDLTQNQVKDKMRVEKEISEIIADIQSEINSRPQYPNIGKKGCVRRLKDLLAHSALEGK